MIAYFILFTWAIIPPFVLNIGWKDDTRLVVLDAIVEEAYLVYLQPGDWIVSIDGHTVQRGEPLFSYPRQSSYRVEFMRGKEQQIEEVPIITSYRFINMWLGSTGMLSVAFWLKL